MKIFAKGRSPRDAFPMSTPNQSGEEVSFASNPGRIALAHEKLRALRPDLYGVRGVWKSLLASIRGGRLLRDFVAEQLRLGDSRAAVAISTTPLLIAAYTDELDCIAMLRLPHELVERFGLSAGSRLLTVNYYGDAPNYDPDLILGPNRDQHWTGFHPLIADFLTDDHARVEDRKHEIAEAEWRRAHALGVEYARLRPGVARDGRPGYASYPALVLFGP